MLSVLRRGGHVQNFLVEVYLPRSRALEARATARRARLAAQALAREGLPIRYIRTTYLPDDETCFLFFEAASTDTVEEASRRANLGRPRIVPAVDASRPARRRARTNEVHSPPGGPEPCQL